LTEGFFAERVASSYDGSSAEMFSPELVGPTVDELAGLAGARAALEFGIATGRIALPLAACGVRADLREFDLPLLGTKWVQSSRPF
jgi:hypothetical protein